MKNPLPIGYVPPTTTEIYVVQEAIKGEWSDVASFDYHAQAMDRVKLYHRVGRGGKFRVIQRTTTVSDAVIYDEL